MAEDSMHTAEKIAGNVNLIAAGRLMTVLGVPIVLALLAWNFNAVLKLQEQAPQLAEKTDVVALQTSQAAMQFRLSSLEMANRDGQQQLQVSRQRRDEQYIDTVRQITEVKTSVEELKRAIDRLTTRLDQRGELTDPRRASADR